MVASDRLSVVNALSENIKSWRCQRQTLVEGSESCCKFRSLYIPIRGPTPNRNSPSEHAEGCGDGQQTVPSDTAISRSGGENMRPTAGHLARGEGGAVRRAAQTLIRLRSIAGHPAHSSEVRTGQTEEPQGESAKKIKQ